MKDVENQNEELKDAGGLFDPGSEKDFFDAIACPSCKETIRKNALYSAAVFHHTETSGCSRTPMFTLTCPHCGYTWVGEKD